VLGDSRLALAATFLTEIRDAVRNYFSLSLAVTLMVPMLTWMQLDSGLASTMRPTEALHRCNMCIVMGWSPNTPGALVTSSSPLSHLDHRAQVRAALPACFCRHVSLPHHSVLHPSLVAHPTHSDSVADAISVTNRLHSLCQRPPQTLRRHETP